MSQEKQVPKENETTKNVNLNEDSKSHGHDEAEFQRLKRNQERFKK